MNMINKINKLPESEFIKVFANIFENARWIAEELYKLKPFEDFNELSSKMMNIFEVSEREKKLKILNDHPDLGNKTKISSLKIGFNNVFGYYLEVRNLHKDKVPENWIRKQTLVNAERYITSELKEFETKILNADQNILILENELFGAYLFITN